MKFTSAYMEKPMEDEKLKYNTLFTGFDADEMVSSIYHEKPRPLEHINRRSLIITDNEVESNFSADVRKEKKHTIANEGIRFDEDKALILNYANISHTNVLKLSDFNDDLHIIFNPSSLDFSNLLVDISESKANLFIDIVDTLRSKSLHSLALCFRIRRSDVNVYVSSFSSQKRVRFANLTNLLLDRSKLNLNLGVFDSFARWRVKNISLSKGSFFSINHVSVASSKDRQDFFFSLHHSAPSTKGRAASRSLFLDEAKGVVKGIIRIDKRARDSDSYLSLHTRLTSEKAGVQVIPMLEIFNKNVRATHSGSTSEIDEDMIFYLESRGIERKTAVSMISEGFLDHLIKRMGAKGFVFKVKDMSKKRILNLPIESEDLLKPIDSSIPSKEEIDEFFERHYKYKNIR